MDQVIGIDLGGTFIKAGLVDRSGQLLSQHKVATRGREFDQVCDQIAEVVREISGPDQLLPACIAVPGGICPDKETISQAPNFPRWNHVNLVSALRNRGLSQVQIENDANLAALGESWLGRGRDFEHMVLFTLGTGVGGGVILNRQIWNGTFGMAGELGHIPIYPEGLLCGCGGSGCLEQYASATALIRAAKAAQSRGLCPLLRSSSGDADFDVRDMADAARAGDADCQALFAAAGQALGIAIAGLLNAMNFPFFAIGGGVSPAFDLLQGAIWREVKGRAFRQPAQGVIIQAAELGNQAGFLGAARLAFLNKVTG